MKNSIVMFTFSVLVCKYTFQANFLQKIEIFISSSNFVLRLISICTVQQRSALVWFRPKILFLGKFGLNKQNCCFKLKFNIDTNLNMENSIVMLTFFDFRVEIPLLGKVAPKNRKFYFKLKFRTETNLNMHNSVVRLAFLFQSRDTVFGQIWSQKLKLLFQTEISQLG